MTPNVAVMPSIPTIKPHNTFARAIESFLRDMRRNEDVKDPFFKEVMSQIGHLLLEDCSPQQSSKCAEEFSAYVAGLEYRQRRDSKTRWASEKLQPLVSGLSQFISAFDVLIQAAPAAVLALYGGARIVLQLAQSFSQCFKTVLDIMEDIGHLLLCYDRFSAAYASSSTMLDLIVQSYKNIICFWQKASKLFNKKAYRAIPIGLVKSLTAEWQARRESLDRDCRRVQVLAQATEAEQRGLDTQSSQKEKQRRCIIDWVKAGEDDANLDVRNDLQAHLNQHHLGTCTWLYEDPTFKAWDKATTNATVWYRAGPGSGKTVLASALVRCLQDRGSKVIYFFYSFNDATRSKPIHAIRCLTLQLLAQCDTIPEKVYRLYEADASNNLFGLRDPVVAATVFQAFLDCSSRTHIILDGLDECSNQSEMKTRFTQLISSNTCGLVKWFLTSRWEDEIHSLAQKVGADDIVPSITTINQDIKRYLQDCTNMDGRASVCVDSWIKASEGNFLWITLMQEILAGASSTCEEDLEDELRKFPRGLTGCYLRRLRQLSSRPERHQELLRRIIVFLIVAQQPLRLSELTNALAIQIGAYDHSNKRVPKRILIQDLCGHFVSLDCDNRGTSEDPLLKLAHKSIQDFFEQNPTSLGVPKELRHFFVNVKSAHLEVGRACLTYLGYARYQYCTDVSAILDSSSEEGHAFLKYATTFWFRHLMETDHSPELLASVECFVGGPAFWTCLKVQSKIAPHLFAKYLETKRGTYRMGTAGRASPRDSVADDRINFASPVPLWLDEYEPNGSAIALGVHSFVMEWHPVLTAHPTAVDECKSEAIGSIEYPCQSSTKSEKLRVFTLLSKEDSNYSEHQRLQSIGFEKGRLYVMTLESKESDLGRQIILQKFRVQRKRSSIRNSRSISISRSANLFSEIHVIHGKDSIEPSLWFLDLHTLNLTTCLGSEQEVYNLPNDVMKMIVGAKGDSTGESWVIMSRTSVVSSQGEAFAYHLSRPTPDSANDDDSGYQSMQSDSDSESESDTSSTLGKEPRSPHCLIMTCQDRPPIWYAWHAAPQVRLRVSCAFHPKEPVVVWTHATHEVSMASLHDGRVTLGIFQEPVDVQLNTAMAVIKELRFSECGNFLHYLLCSFSLDATECTCSVFVSTFEFSTSTIASEPLRRAFPVQRIVHKFCESADSLCPPYVLTAWNPKQVLVALPKLNCDPKIVRFALAENVETASDVRSCQTLKEPIYFPSSTPFRRPQLLLHTPSARLPEKDSESHEHLILALDSAERSSLGKKSVQPMQPPIVVDWSISKTDGWRDWDKELDERSEELRNNLCTWSKLRGSFVDSEKRFCVPVRSGLNWTRKAFLSCA